MDTEIKDGSVENLELKGCPFNLKHTAGQSTAVHASPTARDFFLELICMPVHSPAFLFPPKPVPSFSCVSCGWLVC